MQWRPPLYRRGICALKLDRLVPIEKFFCSSFFSPDGAANHWFDQFSGNESVVCGNWFFHMTGLYSFALAAVYGITLFTQSDYSDTGLLEAIVENKANSATMYSWQVSEYMKGCVINTLIIAPLTGANVVPISRSPKV